MVIPFEYDDAGKFNDGTARVKKGGKWGTINKKNQIVKSFKEEDWLDYWLEETLY